MSAHYTVVTLGAAGPGRDATWTSLKSVADVVRLEEVSPLGYRWGSRVTGLGFDAIRVGLRALRANGRGRYLATGPWVGAVLAASRPDDLVFMGLFAEPGSRQFRFLRRALADRLLLAAASIEADAWIAAGGRAAVALYGNTFGYRLRSDHTASAKLKVFIGGSSDRSSQQIESLVQQLGRSAVESEVTIVDLSQPRSETVGSVTVRYTGQLSADAFGETLRSHDVVFLPVSPTATRGAGHMVTVGALEAGVPVVTTDSPAMVDFCDGLFVRTAADDLAQQLVDVQARFPPQQAQEIRQYWNENFSLRRYFDRIDALLSEELDNH